MSTKIGLVSDPHGTPEPLEQALRSFKGAGVSSIFCAGDIAGYGNDLEQTIALLKQYDCQCICGNHDRAKAHNLSRQDSPATTRFLKALAPQLTDQIEGINLLMVHTSPLDSDKKGIRLLAENGLRIPDELNHWHHRLSDLKTDLLIVGHTHQVFAEQLGQVLVINPGSTLCNHSCAIIHLPQINIEWIALSGKAIVSTWNWQQWVSQNQSL